MSDNILKYNLGELNLEIDFKNMTNEVNSPSNLQKQKLTSPSDSLEKNEKAPFCWFPDLNKNFLDFDDAFQEENFLQNEHFHKILSTKLSYFFEGKNEKML